MICTILYYSFCSARINLSIFPWVPILSHLLLLLFIFLLPFCYFSLRKQLPSWSLQQFAIAETWLLLSYEAALTALSFWCSRSWLLWCPPHFPNAGSSNPCLPYLISVLIQLLSLFCMIIYPHWFLGPAPPTSFSAQFMMLDSPSTCSLVISCR